MEEWNVGKGNCTDGSIILFSLSHSIGLSRYSSQFVEQEAYVFSVIAYGLTLP